MTAVAARRLWLHSSLTSDLKCVMIPQLVAA